MFVASGDLSAAVLRGAGGLTEAVLGGWRVNAVFIAQSGAPFTVNLGVDQANIGAGPAQRPDQIRDPNLPSGEQNRGALVRYGSVCAAGAVHLRQRAAQQRDRSGLRDPRSRRWRRPGLLAARRELEFRWEVFNLLNKANFDLPSRIFGTPNFGRIFSAKKPREMQFGVKLSF